MADMSTLEVEADVSESSLAKISVGQPCEITLDALPDARFRGRISRMVPTVDRAKATVMTKVQLRRDRSAHPAGDERQGVVPVAGRDARAAEAAPRRQSRCARRRATARPSVFVVRDGKAIEVPVTPGARIGDLTAIAGAVKIRREGRAEAAPDLQTGALVKVATK